MATHQLTDATTIAFSESGFAMNIKGIDSLSINGTSIDTTHLGTPTGIRPKVKSIFKEASMTFTVQHDPAVGVPNNKDDDETITIDWGGGGVTDVFTGHVVSYEISGASEAEIFMASVTVNFVTYVSGNLFDS